MIISLIFIIILGVCLYHQIRKNPATLTTGTYGVFIVAILLVNIDRFFQIPQSIHQILWWLMVIFGNVLLFSIAWYSWKRSRDWFVFAVVIGYLLLFVIGYSWHTIRLGMSCLFLYFTLQYFIFLFSSLVYGTVVQSPTNGPLVVLGGGLVDGYRIGKIVDERIHAAVRDAENLKEFPVMIFSGGQGEDELLTEAEAMRQWAVDRYHVPYKKTLLEDKSRNTYQNLQFTDALLNHQAFTFYTSEYHVFRGVLLANQQHIHARGRGGYTRWQYRVPAFTREFAGVMNIRKKQHVLSAIVLVLLVIGYYAL